MSKDQRFSQVLKCADQELAVPRHSRLWRQASHVGDRHDTSQILVQVPVVTILILRTTTGGTTQRTAATSFTLLITTSIRAQLNVLLKTTNMPLVPVVELVTNK